jgi:oligosaccharide repeat unit polymerase
MIEAICVLLASISLFAANFYVSKNVFYPPAIFSLIWTIVLFSYLLFLSNHNGSSYLLETRTLIIFLSGQIIFSVSGLLVFSYLKSEKSEVITERVILFSFDKWLLVFLLGMFPIYIKAIVNIVDNSKLANVNFYLALRHEYVNNGINLGVLDYLNTISVFSFAFVQYKFNFLSNGQLANRKNILYKCLFYLVVFAYAFLSTGRTYFVLLLSIYIAFKVISKSIKKYHIVFASVLVMVIFIANALILGKGASVDNSASENANSIFNNFTIYFLGGAYGFNSLMKTDFIFEYGENVFRFFISVAHALGITSLQPKELVMPYITSPIDSNVYSMYYNYFKDFGYFGLFFNAIWGALHTFFYCKAKLNFRFLNVCCYALLMYPLLMSFFQDQYMSLLSTWIQLLFFAIIANFFITHHTKVSVISEERN